MSGVFNSLKATVITQPLIAVINLANMIIISRLLSPDEIGVQVITASIIMVIAEFKTMGVSAYLIRKESLTNQNIATAFTVCSITSATLAIGLIAASIPLSNFFNEERLVESVIIVALSFFLVPYISINAAILQREFKIAKTATVMLSEAFVSFIAGVILALNGFGYLSLPIAVVAGTLSSYVLHRVIFSRVENFTFSINQFKEVATSGALISYNSIIRRLNQSIPEIVIGKFSNTTNTALYSRGNGLVKFSTGLLANLVNPICTPYFSREKRAGEGLQLAFLTANNIFNSFLYPLLAILFVLSSQLVAIFFGEQWEQAGWVAKYICLSFFFYNVYFNFNSLFIIANKERQLALLQNISICTNISLCVILSKISWELTPLAVVIASFFHFLLQTYFLYRNFEALLLRFHKTMLKNYFILTITIIASYSIHYGLNLLQNNTFFSIVATSVLTGTIWLLTIMILRHNSISVFHQLFKAFVKEK